MNMSLIVKQLKTWIVVSGSKVVLIILGTVALLYLSNLLVRLVIGVVAARTPSPEFQKRIKTFGSMLRYTIGFVMLVSASILVIGEFGIDVRPILAAAGVVGLAVGFGAQKLVQDVISGFFILLEDQIRVGDVVEVNGMGGLVESVNLRLVVLRNLAGNVHYIRTGQIDVVTNMTKEFSCYVFDIGVAYKENPDRVMEVMKEVDVSMRDDPEFGPRILEPLEIMGLDRFENSAMVVRARTKTIPIEQWNVGREFNRRLKSRFDELGIEIPFPHMTVYMGQDKQGGSPPVNVRIVGSGQ